MKVCTTCNTEKPFSEFHVDRTSRTTGGVKSKCKVCCIKKAGEYNKIHRVRISHKQSEKARERKLLAIEYLGGKCNICGQMPHPAAMDFHHKDPSQKEFTPGYIKNNSWKMLTKELDKCLLLCANCHRQLHSKGSI